MKFLVVAALFACSAIVQASGSPHYDVVHNKALEEEIKLAQTSLQMLSTSARMVGSQEVIILQYMHDFGQYEINQLYGKLLRAQVSESDVQDLRNKTDTLAYTTSVNILNTIQNPRDLWSFSSLSWFHLEMSSLDVLTEDINVIQAEERIVWFEVIDIENQLKEQQRQFQDNVDALTVGLSGTEISEINMILDSLKVRVNGDIEILRMQRTQMSGFANDAIAALQKIVDQIP